MNAFEEAFRAAGLIQPKEFVLSAMSFQDKLEALSSPKNWQRFVRRLGRRDTWTIQVSGMAVEVTALSEKMFIATFLEGERRRMTATVTISRRGVFVDKKIPGYREVAEGIVNGLAELILPVWKPEDDGPDNGPDDERPLVNGRRAHWRHLHEMWWEQNSFPPPELIALGVPRTQPGATFVHEVPPMAAAC